MAWSWRLGGRSLIRQQSRKKFGAARGSRLLEATRGWWMYVGPQSFPALCCQSSPKRGNKRPLFRMSALAALQDNHLFFVCIFPLPGRWLFHHWSMALFTDHSGLPTSRGPIGRGSSRDSPSCFIVNALPSRAPLAHSLVG